jgi:hypothetical protein
LLALTLIFIFFFPHWSFGFAPIVQDFSVLSQAIRPCPTDLFAPYFYALLAWLKLLCSFIFGGWDAHRDPAAVQFDEIYILSLPAFRWFRAPYEARHARHRHTCHIVGRRHLLSIGGLDPTKTTFQHGVVEDTPDPFPQGLGLFDITRLNWTTYYNASAAAYEQGAPVAEFYRGRLVFVHAHVSLHRSTFPTKTSIRLLPSFLDVRGVSLYALTSSNQNTQLLPNPYFRDQPRGSRSGLRGIIEKRYTLPGY